VFRRLGHILVVTALLAVVGGHWAFLQSIAWTTMLAQNLQTESLAAAVSKTFDGEHPCSLCDQITEGRKAEKKSAPLDLKLKKFEMAIERSTQVFVQPSDFSLLPLLNASARSVADAPPIPPPRFLTA
jgi:hypothetical protein